jgi:hypothetical protein
MMGAKRDLKAKFRFDISMKEQNIFEKLHNRPPALQSPATTPTYTSCKPSMPQRFWIRPA